MSMDEQMKMEHVCRSGNRAKISLPGVERLEYQQFRVEFKSSPTSEDLQEYYDLYAERIVPLQLQRLKEATGVAHRAIPLAPGSFAVIPEGKEDVM